MLFRFLQIVRVSIYHCQSSLSLFPGATLTHSVCPLTHTPKGHFSILPSLMPKPPPHHWNSLQISVALCRWLVIWPEVIMNPGQGPDRQLFSPSVCPSPALQAIHLYFRTCCLSWQILFGDHAWRM